MLRKLCGRLNRKAIYLSHTWKRFCSGAGTAYHSGAPGQCFALLSFYLRILINSVVSKNISFLQSPFRQGVQIRISETVNEQQWRK